MRHRSSLMSVSAVLGASALLLFSVGAAHAEIPDTTDQAIIDAALENLGAEPISDALAQDLVAGIDAATDAGLVEQAIIDAVTDPQAADAPTTTPNTEQTEPTTDATGQLLDEHLEQDQQLWDEIAPAWMAAFETIRAEFESCREGGDDTSACARTMGFSLQIAHAEAKLAELDARAADVANLPEEEQAAAYGAIAAERTAVEAQLLRSQERLSLIGAAADSAKSERVAQMLTKARERTPGEQAAPQAQESAANGGADSAGSGSTTTPGQSAQNTQRSQAPTQSPSTTRPNSGNGSSNGKSEQGGKPGNTGTNGKSDAR